MTVVTTIATNDNEAVYDGRMSLLPFFPPIFWQGKFDNQPISVIVSVGAFHALLGKLLPGVGHMLQLLTMTERGRPLRHCDAILRLFSKPPSLWAFALSVLETGGSAMGLSATDAWQSRSR
jgi:hypothetical protein